ncbi:MAG: ABC transporter ATP-binding protein [Proteobacteria bacterium]|nr:ABC transporter ATP-binding protein [Pseudomonadota bacterium]
MNPILSVKDLAVEFATYGGSVKAVRGVSFDLNAGEVLAIVGESGCGKSVTFQTLMGLIPMPPGKITRGNAPFEGRDLVSLSDKEMQGIRGKEISMIFQDPLSSLNPTMTVGNQIAEVLIKHRGMSSEEARNEAIALMKLVQIPEASERVDQYPHQFSGGMRQRIMIAIALACKPKILIADEPTTALDVTIQGQIIELLRGLRKEINMAVVLITHDLGVVASLADRVAVLYAGEIVESGPVGDIFKKPSHPYTLGLQAAIPNPLKPEKTDLKAIPGSPPDLFSPPTGCAFAARCPFAMEICTRENPPIFDLSDNRKSKCWLHHKNAPSNLRAEVAHA